MIGKVAYELQLLLIEAFLHSHAFLNKFEMEEEFVRDAEVYENGSVLGAELLFDATAVTLPEVFSDQLIEWNRQVTESENLLHGLKFTHDFQINMTRHLRFEIKILCDQKTVVVVHVRRFSNFHWIAQPGVALGCRQRKPCHRIRVEQPY